MAGKDDSLYGYRRRMAQATDPDMTDLIQPEQMQKNLAKLDANDELASDIQKKITKKGMNKSEADGMRDFMSKYSDKIKAPKGMDIESVADETARLGMKAPNMRNEAIKQFIKKYGKAGKVAGGLGAGLAGEVLMAEELGDPDSIIENPDASPEDRKAAMESMMAESRPEMESQMRKQAMDDMMEKMRQEKLQRAEMLMKKYGRR